MNVSMDCTYLMAKTAASKLMKFLSKDWGMVLKLTNLEYGGTEISDIDQVFYSSDRRQNLRSNGQMGMIGFTRINIMESQW